jgi:hypothetical protein
VQARAPSPTRSARFAKAYNEIDKTILARYRPPAVPVRQEGQMTSADEYGSIRRILTKVKFGHIKDSEKLLVILEEAAFINTWDY